MVKQLISNIFPNCHRCSKWVAREPVKKRKYCTSQARVQWGCYNFVLSPFYVHRSAFFFFFFFSSLLFFGERGYTYLFYILEFYSPLDDNYTRILRNIQSVLYRKFWLRILDFIASWFVIRMSWNLETKKMIPVREHFF